ncbi:MAG TPA: hypothetical protein VGE53_01825 [Candidatus Paceibacterota bacterium]
MKEGSPFTVVSEPKRFSPEDMVAAGEAFATNPVQSESEPAEMFDRSGMATLGEKLASETAESVSAANEATVVQLSEVRERLRGHVETAVETAPSAPETYAESPEATPEQIDTFLRKAYGSDGYKNHSGIYSDSTPAEKFAHVMQSRESLASSSRKSTSWFAGILSSGAGLGAVAALGLTAIPAAVAAPLLAGPAIGYGAYRLLKWNFNRQQRKFAREAEELGITTATTQTRLAA